MREDKKFGDISKMKWLSALIVLSFLFAFSDATISAKLDGKVFPPSEKQKKLFAFSDATISAKLDGKVFPPSEKQKKHFSLC